MKGLLALAACLIPGCIYADVKSPLAYRAPTAVEADAGAGVEVEGIACNKAVLLLFAWGDGGYAAAVADAKAKSGATQLADVRADTRSAPIEVHGESCRNAIGLPLFLFGGFDLVGWADAGYREAVAKAQAQAPGSTSSRGPLLQSSLP